jgi:hypothetical protein
MVLPPEGREGVLDLEVVDGLVTGQDLVQQLAEAGDVPLAVPQVVH